jgi:hypothetical protein
MPASLDLVMEATDRLRSNRDNAADSVEEFRRKGLVSATTCADQIRAGSSGRWQQYGNHELCIRT